MPNDAKIDSTPTLLGIAPVGPTRAPLPRTDPRPQPQAQPAPQPQRIMMYPQRSQAPQARHAPARARAPQAAQPQAQPRQVPARSWPPQHATVKHAPLGAQRAPMYRDSPLASPRVHEPPMYREAPFAAAQPAAASSAPLPLARIALAQVPGRAAHAAPSTQAADAAPAMHAAPAQTPVPSAQRSPALTPVPRRPSQPRVARVGSRAQILPRASAADPSPLPRSQPAAEVSLAQRIQRPAIWLLVIAALAIAGPEYLLFSAATVVIWSAIRYFLRDQP